MSRRVGGGVLLSYIMLGAWAASARAYVWWGSNNDGLVTSELDGSNLQHTTCRDFAVKDARYLYFPGPASGALIGRESLDCSQLDNTFVSDTGAGEGGSVRVILAPGRRRTVRIGLNRAGRQLRRGKRHVRVHLVITQRKTSHHYVTAIQRTITLARSSLTLRRTRSRARGSGR